ncbi:MAG TPA: hypothetical protein ENJ53_00465 [Phaeodactylibacter sp.]|nr:hypothetical protein [Phaeodactylibacter sp.]
MIYIFVKIVKVLFFLKNTYLRSACIVRRPPSAVCRQVERSETSVRRPPSAVINLPLSQKVQNHILRGRWHLVALSCW